MTRPNIIRADTIDLQTQEAPSAKDHTRQPNRPGPLGEGPPAPHQADALKHVELELNEQHGRSPRASQDLSGKELGLLHHEEGETYSSNDGLAHDSNNTMRNAGTSGTIAVEEDLGDVEGDDSEDDMMDKISSSPSIGDDGGCYLQLPPSKQSSSFRVNTPPPRDQSSPDIDALSSSPFYETPAHFPLSFPRNELDQKTPSKVHHHKGRRLKDPDSSFAMAVKESQSTLSIDEHKVMELDESDFDAMEESFDESFDSNDFHHLLLPANDPLLDNSFDDIIESSTQSSPVSTGSWDENKESRPNDDDTEELSFVDGTRMIDSGWGGECLRDTEDIDFEFVYALHTFVATVEGQANATKGDTMVLLDDSNSYWWLVRVVKDSSIGYLPAEHIETPLERLARLNKHRNLDLSQTMLGDEEEKKPGSSLNPLKRAMQRRNTKTVQFTAPSYVEPSDIEYSTDEEGEGDGEFFGQDQDGAAAQNEDKAREAEEAAVVEPLKPRGQLRDGRQNGETPDSTARKGGLSQITSVEDPRSSDDTFERSEDGTSTKSRKGTVRNTDSFFKDDNLETRKINLTPSLLRDDTKGPLSTSLETSELKARPSLDSLEKEASPEKGKDDKKRKEKRGMLGGMFKRKDKKNKGQEKEPDDIEKVSSDVPRESPQPKESLESMSQEVQTTKVTSSLTKPASKLQKSPPVKLSPKSSYVLRETDGGRPDPAEQRPTYVPEPSRVPPSVSEPNGSMRLVEPEADIISEDTAPALNYNPPIQTYQPPVQAQSPTDGRRGMFFPIKDALKSPPSEPKPEKARRAKNRMQMDDFDSSSSDDEPTEQALSERDSQEEPERHLAIARDAQHDEYEEGAPVPFESDPPKERLSESPVEVPSPEELQQTPSQESQRVPSPPSQRPSPLEQQRTPHQPPPLMIDTSSQEDPSTSPVSPISSPELVKAPNEETAREETPASTAQSSTPTWSDASLRAYMEDDSEIKDLLVIVHDKSNVQPARRDHPIVKNMYSEQNRKLGEISNRLDGLLGDYLARKSRTTVR